MTYTTPPGWYPDPGHSGDGPQRERWWDGSAWTDELRATSTAQWAPPTAPASPGAPPHPGLPPHPVAPPPRRVGRGRRAAVAVTAVVVATALAGGFYLLGRDGGADASARAGDVPSASASPPTGGERDPDPEGPGGRGGPGDDGDGGGPRGPRTEDGYATDAASGISIPVPDGWTGESGVVGAGVTTGKYSCPGDTSQSCVRGGVFSAPAAAMRIRATTPKAAAEADIRANAQESYGGESYGEISSHEELRSEAVTVAGQKGYLVRWKVVTGKGDDGYVQSLAFTSPSAPGLLVVVRSGFDINDKAPKLSVMDEITRGIKAAKGMGNGGGQEV